MAKKELTPCGVLFDSMKRLGGISHSETASLVLSGKPLADGRSAMSRANDDPTWLSRYVVHAPMETVQSQYFAEPALSAMRLIARLKSAKVKHAGSTDILDMLETSICPKMISSLESHGQNAQVCVNALARLSHAEGLSRVECEEAAMVLLVSTVAYGNVRRAVDYTFSYAKSSWGALADRTPLMEVLPSAGDASQQEARAIGLMRIDGGYTAGTPLWLRPAHDGFEIGTMAFGENGIVDVGKHVSAHHARISCSADGVWQIEDLGSTNGTLLVSGADGSAAEVRPGAPCNIRPGDEIRLAGDTRFIVLAG